jgi:hypothetical protein
LRYETGCRKIGVRDRGPIGHAGGDRHVGGRICKHDATTIGMTRALSPERTKEISMFLALFAIFLVFWLLGFLAFHVAGGLIHLLLIIAVISLVVHFLRR